MKTLRVAESDPAGLRGALMTLRRVVASRPDVVVAPAAGGRAAFVRLIPVVSFAAVSASGPGSVVARWLERTQARRSRLVFSTGRAQAVAFALRHGVSPTRFRIAASGNPDDQIIERELGAIAARRRNWHSA